MNPITFIFTLLNKNVPMTAPEKEGLQREASDWWEVEADKTKLGKLVKDWGQKWYMRLLLAVLYIPMSRWIKDFMNPIVSEEDEEDD
jgi:hypothetical protein